MRINAITHSIFLPYAFHVARLVFDQFFNCQRQNHIPVKCPNLLLLPRNLVSANSIETRARERFYKLIREPQVTLPSRIAL
jgi:hypothetical protein